MRTWIIQALAAGGTITIKSMVPGYRVFQARMSWPDENDVAGEVSTDVERALDNLERSLAEDAALEMQRKGGV